MLQPFINIETQEEPCDGFNIVNMFSRTWAGTEKGCYLKSQNEIKSYTQIQEELTQNGQGSIECELPIPEVGSVEQV
jgi:hypothetical protein